MVHRIKRVRMRSMPLIGENVAPVCWRGRKLLLEDLADEIAVRQLRRRMQADRKRILDLQDSPSLEQLAGKFVFSLLFRLG
jgi:hypothetical protein